MKKDGGPAFPQPVEIAGRGMTLRDYFAAAALPAILINDETSKRLHGADWLAVEAFRIADAMIERSGR